MRVSRPIFFVGFPRSGTTVIFEAFSRHEDLGWPSVYTAKFPRQPWINLLRQVLDNRRIRLIGRKGNGSGKIVFGNRFLPQTNEAYSFWDIHLGRNFSRSFMRGETADSNSAAQVQNAVEKILIWQGRSRFAAKITGPTRMSILSSAFPDAQFIHVIRDGRAVVHSLLRTKFWRAKGGVQEPFWKGGLTNEELRFWRESDNDPGVLAALQWIKVIRVARVESQEIGESRYKEIRYEDFVESPQAAFQQLFDFCGMSNSELVYRYLGDGVLLNMNYKYRTEFSDHNIEKLTAVMEPLLRELGYLTPSQ